MGGACRSINECFSRIHYSPRNYEQLRLFSHHPAKQNWEDIVTTVSKLDLDTDGEVRSGRHMNSQNIRVT